MTDAGTTHPLVTDYLDRLRHEARRLPDDQARELIADITEHLEVGLEADPGEAEVRNALDRLGTPTELVDAAGGTPSAPAGPASATSRSRKVEIGAIVALVGAELLVILLPLAALLWIVGVVLLVVAQSWTGQQKLRGFLSLATGFPLVLLVLSIALAGGSSETCTSSPVPAGRGAAPAPADITCTSSSTGAPTWVAVAVLVALGIYLVWQVLSVRALLRAPQATKSSQLSAR